MRLTLSNSPAIFNNSEEESVLPISKDRMEKPRSLLLPKEVLPDLKILEMASLVSP